MAKIVIYSPHPIAQSMAGPAIRSWEFAKILTLKHDVVLISPQTPTIQAEGFTLISKTDPLIKKILREAHVMVTQTLSFSQALKAKYYKIKIIIDAYDPVPLELLEQFKHDSLEQRHEINVSSISNLIFNFEMAHGIICASEKQRDLWLGFLLGQKKITPQLYDQDHTLRQLISVVPFGLSNIPAKKTGPGLREKFGFSEQDKIVLWGGGIWDWFDPLSLIRAIKLISETRSDIKLVFMAVKSSAVCANPVKMSEKSIHLAHQLGLLNRLVFFNEGWVPYEERQNMLLEAHIGASTHFDHLETRFSFRTRLLDYIWAELPILATTGDTFAEWIDKEGLGCVVPYQDVPALAKAILSIIDDPTTTMKMKANLARIREQFYWESVTKPLLDMIDLHASQTDKIRWNYRDTSAFFSYIYTKVKEKGVRACLRKIFTNNSKAKVT